MKSFGMGDVWVAVGWSSDIIPAAKRMSDVAVIVPKSGASLWADLWVCVGFACTTSALYNRLIIPCLYLLLFFLLCTSALSCILLFQDLCVFFNHMMQLPYAFSLSF